MRYCTPLAILKQSVQHFSEITMSTSPKILCIIIVHKYSVHPVNACMLCTVSNASITKSIKAMDFHKYTMLNALQSQLDNMHNKCEVILYIQNMQQ